MTIEQNAKRDQMLPPPIPNTNNHRKRLLLGLSGVFLLLGMVYLFYWLLWGRYEETTDDAYVSGNSVQVMSHIPGRVTQISAEETDLVKKGEIVVQLDKADAEIALKLAQAQLGLIVRQVSRYYDEVNQLKANVQAQQDNFERATEDYKRRQGLVVNKSISEEDLRHAKIALDSARDAVTVAKQQLAGAITLVGNTDLYHHPQVEQAIVNVRNAYLQWRRTTVYAPVTGYVAKRPVQVGQQINTNTILMVIVPLEQVWVDANFKESQLKNIRIGQSAEAISDAYGSGVKYKGTVIGLNPGTGSAFDLLPPQNATGNWIKIVQRLPVRIGLDKEQLKRYPLRKGLSMTVTVNTRNRKGEVLEQDSSTKVIYESADDSADLQEADKIIDNILNDNAKNTSPITP